MLFSLFAASASSAESDPLIKLVELKGNRKINDEMIHSRMKSRIGSPFSKNTVQDDIKKLYAIGYFDDIRVEIDTFEGGVRLTFIFTEKPTIISLDFQGNKEFETKDLKEKLSITSGAIANLSLITDNVNKIISFYQSEGYWLVRVFPIIREISEDAAALTFRVEEGTKVKIRKISFEGNRALQEKKIRKVMKTKEWWLFSFLTGSGTYKKDQIKEDIDRIRGLYNNNGFIYAAVSEPETALSDDSKNIFLKISLSEGDQYRTGELKIKGNSVFTDAELLEKIGIRTGDIFDRSALRTDIDKITDLYMEKGYAQVDINPLISVSRDEKTANITLSITEGGIFRVGRINITGNTKTRDKVIRREMRLDEGDIFNKKLLTRSYQRINNLNYFETANINPVPRAEEQLVDMDISVKEKLTGMLSIGGGYSSLDKLLFMSEITQENLFGKGLHLKFKVDLSSRRSNYRISLINPWFMDKPVTASFSLYKEVFRYLDYDKNSMGTAIGFGKELSEYVGGNIVYNLEDVEIKNVSENASELIKDQAGTKLTSSISPSIWKNTLDNNMDPTTGSKLALYTTIAGLGGDNYFFKGVADSTRYFPVMKESAFSIRGRFGYATGYSGRELPLYERFYVGGMSTVRGLGFGEGGPRNDEGEKIGGERELLFNAEYIIPLVKDIRLKGVLFYDYGAAFEDAISFNDMRRTAGAGIRWISPLGPIRLEWGFNLDPRKDESNDKIEFSLGGFF
ncbi:MAG: outer membrane protein assembly factor BamA [Nitrospirota bacterium]|nr:outer membrane protein assembly factor BamA [Nitrospirota bacterium]